MKRRPLPISAATIAGVGVLAPVARKTSENSMSGMNMQGMDMKGMGSGNGGAKVGARLTELPVGQPLSELAKLANTSSAQGVFEATHDSGPAHHEFVPGLKTEVLVHNSSVPGSLIEVTEGDKFKVGEPAARKRIEIGENMGMANGGMTMDFLLDCKKFDMNRVDLKAKLGDVELWEIANKADMDQPFHIHGGQFQVVERELKCNVTPSPYLAWKDTVNIARGETVRLKIRQAFAGPRMYHYLILEHEDAGMMGTLEVV